MKDTSFESKVKFPLWLNPESLKMVEDLYKEDDCRSRSEYIEKAIRFYSGYLNSNRAETYLPNILVSTIKSIMKESTERTNRLIFKLAVELAMTMNVVCATNEIDESALSKLRGDCIKAIKKTNGTFSFDDAAKWQG